MSSSRRLAAILAADIVGYSRLMGADEEGTLARLRSLRATITDPKIAEHNGRIVKTTGDGLLVEFHSVVDALRCAAEIQTAVANMAQPPDRRIQLRIGIHQGDIVLEDDGDIFGDGVNIAARLESIAEPGGICVSARVQEDASGRLPLSFLDMGEQALKNISRPVRAYRVRPAPPPGSPAERTVVQTRPAASPSSGPLRPGAVLGHTYAIEQPIGRGSLGEVYRAKHIELGTAHAITLIQSTVAGDPKTAQLLVEEVRKLASVRHDAVISYQGLFRDEQGMRYLVMEYVDGPSLAEIIAGRRLEADEVLALRDRLAEGLAAVHARGIIHRDLSPDNVILPDGEVGRAKLIGFGFAQTAETGDATMIGVNLMTRHGYASPEQLGQFGGRVDSRSDLYSLGLVLAAASIGFGRMLQMGATPGQAIEARQKKPDLSPVPAPLRPAIAPLLEPRPEDRPASVRELLAGGAPQPAAARAATGGRSFWLLAAGVVAAVLVAGGMLVTLYRPGPSSSVPLDELRTRLAAATGSFACGSVGFTVAPDRSVRLAGHVASPDDLMRLRREVAAIPGIGQPSYDVQLMGRPHCEVASLLVPLADPALRDGLSLTFAGKPNEAHLGERPSIEVRVPGFDSYVYVDYFDSGGDVLHLFPNERDRFNLRPWRNRFVLFKTPLWTVCGNVGRQLITIVASATRLFPSPRPEVEDAAGYIASLGESLKKLPKGQGAVAQLLFFELREAPPWINPDVVCRS